MKRKYLSFKGKNVLVYGFAGSGKSAAELLVKNKANVFIYDDDINKRNEAKRGGFQVISKLTNSQILKMFCMVVSPAIPFNNKFLDFARKNYVVVISELELGFMLCKNKIVAITGTNGKTTTVQLLTGIINTQTKAIAVGNVGKPITRAILNKNKGVFVVEVSSFMLENINKFLPAVASITNITPDHLNRHKTFKNYANLKFNIYKNFTKPQTAIINLDDKLTSAFNYKYCNKITYSLLSNNCNATIKNNNLIFNNKIVCGLNNIKLAGNHNLQNILCAVSFAKVLKIKNKNIEKALKTFAPQKHRFEKLKTVNGILFINDSKSTNIDSTISACKSLKNITILLVGGYDKNLDYKELFKSLPSSVQRVVCYGTIANKLLQDANHVGVYNVNKTAQLKDAFSCAINFAKAGDTILLSPATSSFDEFENYERRGEYFEKLVNDYDNSLQNN